MSENTKIEWADHTFNPWVGCTKVSPACDHCYAEGWAKREHFDIALSKRAEAVRAGAIEIAWLDTCRIVRERTAAVAKQPGSEAS